MADPRLPRPVPPARTGASPQPPRGRPDPNPMRIMIGMAGLASATALLTAMLPSVVPDQVAVADAVDTTTTALGPAPSVIHVTKVVTLEPGQTAPPNASVVVRPQPTPRIRVKVVTKQSGTP